MKVKPSNLLLSTVCAAAVASGIAQAQANSLWVKAGNSEQSMFADKIARGIGDILTVKLDEDITATQDALVRTEDNYQGGAGLGVALNSFFNQFLQAAPKWFGMATGIPVNDDDVTIPTIDLASSSKWNGGGTTQDSLSFKNPDNSGGTAVTVVDILPNGNLIVEGAKIIRTSNQDLYGYFRGVVRPVDIQPDNTIKSSKIADAQVEFIPSGQLSEAQKKGWLLRGWEKIKPF
jgi:flagellar L-ring protein precursor FlgH